MLVDSPSDDGVLTKEAMDAIWELHNLVLEIEVSINNIASYHRNTHPTRLGDIYEFL